MRKALIRFLSKLVVYFLRTCIVSVCNAAAKKTLKRAKKKGGEIFCC